MKFEYTNTCSCQIYDVESGEMFDAQDCFGDCWEYQLYDFSEITESLFKNNSTNWWRISNIRLWNGEVGGFAKAENPLELLKAMTVDSEWIIRGEIFSDKIEYSLSHHDAPMGSNSLVTIVSEDEKESYGLY